MNARRRLFQLMANSIVVQTQWRDGDETATDPLADGGTKTPLSVVLALIAILAVVTVLARGHRRRWS